jgi:hypothetical protein
LIKIYNDAQKLIAVMENFPAPEHEDIPATAEKFASEGAEILAGLGEQLDSAEDLVADEFWLVTNY